MKAITIWQPGAELIVAGGKDIENRRWATDHRGPLLIHAAAGRHEGWVQEWLCWATNDPVRRLTIDAVLPMDPQHFGGLVGIAWLLDCVTTSHSPWWEGAIGWELARATRLPFVPWRGRQKLWDVDTARLPDAVQVLIRHWVHAACREYNSTSDPNVEDWRPDEASSCARRPTGNGRAQ